MLQHIRGEVTYNTNEEGDGKISVLLPQVNADHPVPVYMTSPGYQVGGGGVLVFPDTGDQIICLRDLNTSEIFYLATILKADKPAPGTGLIDFSTIPKNTYNKGGKPVKQTFTNSAGAGLTLTRSHDPTPHTEIVNSVRLSSEKGKKVVIDDSPGVEAVIVRNQHGDGLTIKGDADKVLAGRTVDLHSESNQTFTCFGGQMKHLVVDGRDLHIENTSTGAMAQQPAPENWPNPEGQGPKQYGGIYLMSEWGDCSVSTKAEDGRIFIVTPNARIQITENGAVQIDAASDIQVRSEGNISLQAEGDLNMEAANINLNTTGNLKARGTNEVSISSSGPTNIDGGAINLNSNASNMPDPTEDNAPRDLNDYYH
tara:strand:- start:2610 stop:3716 length:1107 start_codon:yes stop_codon:yes gene_type:complete